jgi:hypothetical protein
MMKFRNILFLAILLGTGAAQAQPFSVPAPAWRATLKVVDEAGVPVGGAKIQIGYDMTADVITGLSDPDGVFIAAHAGGSDDLVIDAKKAGYYPFSIRYHLGSNDDPGKWNMVQTVVLKKIIKPVPMYAKSVNLKLPVFDRPVGYDFEVGDWVGPYGKGTNADIIFLGHREKRGAINSNYQLTVSFSNKQDGIQEFNVPQYYLHTQGSALLSAQEAPATGYQSQWIQTKRRRPDKPNESNWSEYRDYYIRVRTVVDDKGNLVSACYGKIYGGFLRFTYYLNPESNDQNVEFDPARNLMKNLNDLEEVSQP